MEVIMVNVNWMYNRMLMVVELVVLELATRM